MSTVLVDETFEIYVQMRVSGKQAKAVLDALRVRIETMQSNERAELVRRVKVWEEEHKSAKTSISTTQKMPALKPLDGAGAASGKKAPCPRCGKLNTVGEVFCVHCGNFLSTESSPHETTRFADPDMQAMSPDFFCY